MSCKWSETVERFDCICIMRLYVHAQSCNDEPADLQQEQCSQYDDREFDGGKQYTWKPYTDGKYSVVNFVKVWYSLIATSDTQIFHTSTCLVWASLILKEYEKTQLMLGYWAGTYLFYLLRQSSFTKYA